MTGMWSQHAQTFILIFAAFTTLAFAIPIFAFTRLWCRVLLWRVPEDTDLAFYFGRCVGAFALVTEVFLVRAGLTGEGLTVMYDYMTLFCVSMVAVHVWGAIEGSQPWTETAEIAFWALLIGAFIAFRPITG